MLNVGRRSVRLPSILKSGKAAKAARSALDFAKRAAARSDAAEPERFEFDAGLYAAKEVVDALRRLFFGVCAFCETPLPPGSGEVFHYRPRSGAIDQHGKSSEAHYAWLAYDWSNLYLACETCNSLSGTRFPVEKRRAKPGATGVELLAEEPMLLDPCNPDHAPLVYLGFNAEGRVAGLKPEGEMTVRVFGLNREVLVQGRLAVRAEVEAARDLVFEALEIGQEGLATLLMEDLLAYTLPGSPFAAFATQWLGQTAFVSERRVPKEDKAWYRSTLHGRLGPAAFTDGSVLKTAFDRLAFEEDEERKRSVAVASKAGDLALMAPRIDRIQIRNFRAIGRLDLRFSAPEKEQAPWMMLLGENGVGKSSLLQATTLALLGEAGVKRLKLKPRDILRRAPGVTKGSIQVTLAGRQKPIELRFDKEEEEFGGGFTFIPRVPQVLLMAYGSTRLLDSGKSGAADEIRPYARVRNLFDPRVQLGRIDEYLNESRRSTFKRIMLTLKDLLFLPRNAKFVREDKTVKVDGLGPRVALDELSDGYQSTVALAIDICKVLLSFAEKTGASKDLRHAEGIVLVDEIGAHLHPIWRKQVVHSLRKAFPRVQFLMTTHDPLCLRGMRNGEVVVLKRNARKEVYAVEDLPPIEGMRIDQILASEHFGLGSSLDEEVEEVIRDYHRLLGLRKRSAGQERKFRKARARLNAFEVLGATRRERVLYEVIDRHLAREQEARPAEKGGPRLSTSMAAEMESLLKGGLA